MALVVADRVRDTSTSTGTGVFTVVGTAPSTYQTFSAVCSVNDTLPYFIQHQTLNEWEVGIATYSASNQLTRTTVLSSSNANAAVNFSVGTKDVVLGIPARNAYGPDRDSSSNYSMPAALTVTTSVTSPIMIGGTGAASTLILESTSGTGTTDAIIMKTASQVERWRLATDAAVTHTNNSSGTSGPSYRFFFDKTGAAAALDKLGVLDFYGKDSGAATQQYAQFFGQILSTTAGTERGCLSGDVIAGGTMASALLGNEMMLLGYNTASFFEFVFRCPNGWSGYMELESFSNGAQGPTYGLWHRSSSPVAGDVMGRLEYAGMDTVAGVATNYTTYAEISCVLEDPVDGQESGSIVFDTSNAGTYAQRAILTYDGQLMVGAGRTSDSERLAASSDPTQFATAGLYAVGANTSGAFQIMRKTRGSTPTSHTIVNSGDRTGIIAFQGSDGSAYRYTGAIASDVDGAPGSGDMPGRLMFFTTPDGSTSPTERHRINNAGAEFFIGISTTASAANAFLDSGSSPVNSLLRSTSSLRYKDNVEKIEPQRAEAVLTLEPIWFRSKAKADNPDWSFYGYGAEDVAAVDPRLVSWGYAEEDYDEVTQYRPGAGSFKERVLKAGAVKVPDGVQYDRLLLLQVSALKAKCATYEDRILALESKK